MRSASDGHGTCLALGGARLVQVHSKPSRQGSPFLYIALPASEQAQHDVQERTDQEGLDCEREAARGARLVALFVRAVLPVGIILAAAVAAAALERAPRGEPEVYRGVLLCPVFADVAALHLRKVSGLSNEYGTIEGNHRRNIGRRNMAPVVTESSGRGGGAGQRVEESCINT